MIRDIIPKILFSLLTLYGKGAKSFCQPFWHKFLFGFTFPARHFSYNALLLEDTSFFLEGIKENTRSMTNKFDGTYEHLLPHQLNDDISNNIGKLIRKYDPVPEDAINDEGFKEFIEYINHLHMLDGQPFSNENKRKLVMFLQDFCKGNEKHSSGFTGGQILLLVLRACLQTE